MINLKQIQPASVRLRASGHCSLIEQIILASSNCLRNHIGLKPEELLPAPVPRFVTRKNPSLDNYFAELLLRSCYEPVDYLPSYEEHVIRGDQDELPTTQNMRLAGSVLIGIGGRSSNPEFLKVYDEHGFHGTRTAPSASQVVFEERFHSEDHRLGVASVRLMLQEVNSIDSQGGATFDHLYNLLKSLNVAEFIQPGFVFEPLHPQWKRAVLGASLMSVCVGRTEFDRYDLDAATHDLGREWDTYLARVEKRIKYGFPDKIIPNATGQIKQYILQPKEPTLSDAPYHLTLKRVLYAFRHFWHPSVVAYLLEFYFEALRQAQQSFEEIKNADISLRRLPGNHAFLYYRKELKDRIPHRGLLSRLNDQAIKGLVLVFDPAHEILAAFGSRHLPKKIWRHFVEALLKAEGDEVWYVPKSDNDGYANFMLNGTESYQGNPKTGLTENDFFRIFSEAVNASNVRNANRTHDE